MNVRTLVIPSLLLLLGPAGCDEDEEHEHGQVADMAVAPDFAVAPDMMVTTAYARVAHLSPNKGPIDVCVAPHGSTAFQGPLLKAAGVSPNGLAYAQVTRYLALAPGQYDVRVVDGAATSCAVGLGTDATSLPALAAGSWTTLAGEGLIPPVQTSPFAIRAYADDANADPANVKVRFIHAAPDVPAVDVGLGSGASFTPVFVNVAYSNVGVATTPPSDPNGFVTIPPPATGPTLSARLHDAPTTDALTVTLPTAPRAGIIATAFAIGSATAGSHPLQLLFCLDNEPTKGVLTACTALP